MSSLAPNLDQYQLKAKLRTLCLTENTKLIFNWIASHPDQLKEPRDKTKILEYCAFSNKTKSMEYLLSLGFLEDAKHKSELLIKSSMYGCTKSVIALVKLGFNVDLVAKDGMSALKGACKNGHYGATKTLLKVGAKPNTTTHEELLTASINKKGETTRLILEVYPKELLEELNNGNLTLAQSSSLVSITGRGWLAIKNADELIQKIAESILKDESKEKVQKLIKGKDNTLEI